jgi:hypothetical protein
MPLMVEQLAGQVREFAELELADRDRLRSFGEGSCGGRSAIARRPST